MSNPWLQQIKNPRRWLGRLAIFGVLLFVMSFTFVVSFPALGFGNTNPMILVTNLIAALAASWFFGERLRVSIVRKGGASFLWVGPMFAGLAALTMALLGMFLYWLTQLTEESPRDGNPWFGAVLLLTLYLPISFVGGVIGGLFVWRGSRREML